MYMYIINIILKQVLSEISISVLALSRENVSKMYTHSTLIYSMARVRDGLAQTSNCITSSYTAVGSSMVVYTTFALVW